MGFFIFAKINFMRFIFLLLVIVTSSCASVEKHNAMINQPIAPEKLKQDVDFIQHKITKYHPDLYRYISQKDLNQKFDSLKQHISQPLTSFEFYEQLMPTLVTIKQGHITALPIQKKFTKKQSNAEKKKGFNPLVHLDFETFNDKLYIIENRAKTADLQLGDEVISMNHIPVDNLLTRVKKLYASDGFNTTLYNRFSAKYLPSYFSMKYGVQDSILFDIKRRDTLHQVWLYRKDKKNIEKIEPKKWTKFQKDSIKLVENEHEMRGYNPKNKKYNRNFNYITPDSSVAHLKIRSFSEGNFKKFYKKTFLSLKNNNSKQLIIDLRDNGGGRLSEITELYSYLTRDSTFVMVEKQKVTQKTSMFQIRYFAGGGVVSKFFRAVSAPLFYPVVYFKTVKDKDQYYFSTKFWKPQTIKENAFQGEVFVLTNGNSFSASSILSAQLQGHNIASIIGEETGGAYNSTVAGLMPMYVLPNSKAKVRFGLQEISPTVQSKIDGRGIFPDVEIIPTLEDRLQQKDPEIDYILQRFKINHSVTQ